VTWRRLSPGRREWRLGLAALFRRLGPLAGFKALQDFDRGLARPFALRPAFSRRQRPLLGRRANPGAAPLPCSSAGSNPAAATVSAASAASRAPRAAAMGAAPRSSMVSRSGGFQLMPGKVSSSEADHLVLDAIMPARRGKPSTTSALDAP